MQDNVWGAANLVRGTYAGEFGGTYEELLGVSKVVGTLGQVAGRITWKWPRGTTEVKSYPGMIMGNKPGYASSWTQPGGYNVILPDGSISQTFPSGKTPNSWFPMQIPFAAQIQMAASYQHNITPTGQGHFSYDIWLQSMPTQTVGWNSQGEITHEIMIPLSSWGNYGVYPTGRNPAWYVTDATIDGRLYHMYRALQFGGGWQFIVFQPDKPIPSGTVLNFTSMLTYLRSMGWVQSQWLVSIELGVEPVYGVGDITLYDYRIWK